MNINAVHRLNLWCETKDGEIAPVDIATGAMPPIETHPYACARFPLTVQTQHYARRPDGGYGSHDSIAVFSASANEELVLALATGGKFRRQPRVSLEHALIIVSEACSRCLNALAYDYGLTWGYQEGSDEWRQVRTECEMCRPKSVGEGEAR